MPYAKFWECTFGKENYLDQCECFKEYYPPGMIRGFFLVEKRSIVGFLVYCKKLGELVIDRGDSLEEIDLFDICFRLVDQSRRNQGFEIVSCFQLR